MRQFGRTLTWLMLLSVASISLFAPSPSTTAQQMRVAQQMATVMPTATTPPQPECTSHEGQMEIVSSATALKVGEPVTLTATLHNLGQCTDPAYPQFWWPKYSIWGGETDDPPILSPLPPEPIYTEEPVLPGQRQSVSFVLQANSSGTVSLQAHASYANHLGYPGPSFWTSSISEPITITVSVAEGEEPVDVPAYLPMLLHREQGEDER